MELVNFNAEQLALLGAIVVGVNELLVRLRAKDMWVAATIASAAILGGLIGLYYDIDFISGIAAGFGAAGAIRTLSAIGNKSTPSESKVLDNGPQ